MALNVDTLNKVIEIFITKNWDLEHSEEFTRYCEMLESMNDEQQTLIIELTRNYIRLDMPRYEPLARIALSKLSDKILPGISRVYLLPLLAPKDFGRSKSSTFVKYMFQGVSLQSHPVFADKKVFFLDSPQRGLPQNLTTQPFLILLVDDFIGTGETAVSAVNYLVNELEIPKQMIVVLALAAQRAGVQELDALGILTVTSIERTKGISDYFPSPLKERYIALMKEIEDDIQVSDDFRFGYGASEALITMNRTPNNTFPVFWLERSQLSKKTCLAPFPR